MFLVFHIHFALRCKDGAKTGCSSGKHTIEHIDSETGTDYHVYKVSNTH